MHDRWCQDTVLQRWGESSALGMSLLENEITTQGFQKNAKLRFFFVTFVWKANTTTGICKKDIKRAYYFPLTLPINP